MRLIGMMDSPYVRRVAISLKFMQLPFEHEQTSVFRHYDSFARTNPVVKAPTLVTDDGIVLMDSTLILDHVERLVPAERRLTPADIHQHARSQHIIGVALAAGEKAVQLYYERTLRPPEKQHQPWMDRVQQQLLAAYGLLNQDLGTGDQWLFGPQPMQADITAAVVWRFTQHVLSDVVTPDDYPVVARFSQRAEALPQFMSSPLE